MNTLHKLHALQDQIVCRSTLYSLQGEAFENKEFSVYNRINTVLRSYPKQEKFKIDLEFRDEEHDFCGLSYNPNYITPDEIGLAKAVSPDDIYTYITKIIIETIEVSGHLPWQRSWDQEMTIWDGLQAVNYDSKKPYRGINYWFTNFKIVEKKGKRKLVPRDLTNPYFLTRNQIKKHKGSIRKGSKGIRVFYFTKLYSHTEILSNGKKLSISTYDKKKFVTWLVANQHKIKGLKKKLYTIEQLSNSYIPILKYYIVFHGADIIGIKWDTFKENKNPKLPKKERIVIAENIVKAMPKAPEIIYKGNQPAYYPSFDHVRMTPIEAFKSEQEYYSTLFHELIHSTGHSSRLGRFNKAGKNEKAYAFEELIAEMGAVFLCAESGILFSVINNSASYLAGWNKKLVGKLKKDNRYFFRASSKAQAAADYILDRDKKGNPAYLKIKPKKVTPKEKSKSNKSPKDKKQLQLALAGKQPKLTKAEKLKAQKKAIAKSLGLEYNQVFQANGRLRSGFVYEGPGKVKRVKKKLLSRKSTQVQVAKKNKKKGLSCPDVTPPNTLKSPVVKPSNKCHKVEPTETKKRFSAHDILNMDFKDMTLPPDWAILFPDAPEKMNVAFMGKPKNGKSMSACQWGAIVGKGKKILYNFADQGISKSTKKILEISGLAKLSDLTVTSTRTLDELENDIKDLQPDLVFIDMINNYIDNEGVTPVEFETRFLKGYPDISFNLVFEATKTGDFKGPQKWTHLPDQLIMIEDYVMNSRGRYGSGKRITWDSEVQKINSSLYEEVNDALVLFKEQNGISTSSTVTDDITTHGSPKTFLKVD